MIEAAARSPGRLLFGGPCSTFTRMDWPNSRLTSLLRITHPIIQAPMAGAATPELAIAVSDAGGLGSLGCEGMSEGEVRQAVATMRAGTANPFNLNFFTHPAPFIDPAIWAGTRQRLAPWYEKFGLTPPASKTPQLGPGFGEEKLRLLLDLRPPVVSFHFGVPVATSIAALKQAGILLLSTATSVAEAKSLAAAGIDAIIAQGFEAGGHRGSHQPAALQDGIGTLALVPQVVDAVRQPVIAAGGIADGRGIAAALTLGASGVQIGTGFLRCPEAGTDHMRRALLAQAADTDTMMTAAVSGRAARARRSRYALEMERIVDLAPFPSLYELSWPLIEKGDVEEASFHLYGQSAALARDLRAAELMASLVAETEAAISGLASPSVADR